MTKAKSIYILLLATVLFSCKKKEVEPTEENELITTVKLNFEANGSTKTFQFKDLDGDGGTAPTVDKIVLDARKTYKLRIELLNEAATPAENITQEVSDEADEHLVVYTTSNQIASYVYTDKDANNLPIGLIGEYTTNLANTGKLQVQLRHQPPVAGKASKDGSPAPGSDDLNITFDLEIK
jgi:hypothetical protein